MFKFISAKLNSFITLISQFNIILFLLFFICIFFTQIQIYAASINHNEKIPKAVTRFAEKNKCTDIEKNTYFKRPWFGYKGYDVYNGRFNNGDLCIILYKYGFTRFPRYDKDEHLEVTFMKSPKTLPPGLWWQYFWEIKRFHID